MRHVPLHSFGSCFRNQQSSQPKLDVAARYPFFISFENVVMEDYASEKFFEGFALPSTVMVYLGAPDARSLAPAPGSFVDALRFPEPAQLASHIIALSQDREAFNAHFAWRTEERISPNFTQALRRSFASGTAGGGPMCRICRAVRESCDG